jgi:hypothetical protein
MSLPRKEPDVFRLPGLQPFVSALTPAFRRRVSITLFPTDYPRHHCGGLRHARVNHATRDGPEQYNSPCAPLLPVRPRSCCQEPLQVRSAQPPGVLFSRDDLQRRAWLCATESPTCPRKASSKNAMARQMSQRHPRFLVPKLAPVPLLHHKKLYTMNLLCRRKAAAWDETSLELHVLGPNGATQRSAMLCLRACSGSLLSPLSRHWRYV